MKFNLSKTKYSRGLYLRCIAVIFAFIQCCYAETVINTKEEFQNFVYEAGWRANAGYYDKSLRKDKWYNDKIYEDSIYKVIPQAIADCMQKKAEFSNVGKIVTFEANDHTKYSYENWNAVVLWNYLEYAIHKHGALSNDGVSEVGEKLKTYYGEEYWKYINKAVSDIKSYATDLNLYDYIAEIKDNEDDNRYYQIEHTFNEYTKEAQIDITGIANITINKGKPTTKVYEKRDATTVPTSEDEIHALPNFAHINNEEGVEISANKCWFNSVMLNMYNSKTIHKVINELQARSHDNTMPSYWIQQIFNDIRSGDMTRYGDHLKGLIWAQELLNKKKKRNNNQIKVEVINTNAQKNPMYAWDIIYNSVCREAEECDKASGSTLIANIKGQCCEKAINNLSCSNGCERNWEREILMQWAASDVKNIADVIKNQELKHQIGDNTSYCSFCHKEGKIKTQDTILHMPNILVFNRPEPHDHTSLTEMNIPEQIDIATKNRNYNYRIIGIVASASSNHVIAQIRCEDGKWYEVNDLTVPNVKKIKYIPIRKESRMAFYEKVLD